MGGSFAKIEEGACMGGNFAKIEEAGGAAL